MLNFFGSTTACVESFLHSAVTASVWKVQIRAHWSRGQGGGLLSSLSAVMLLRIITHITSSLSLPVALSQLALPNTLTTLLSVIF